MSDLLFASKMKKAECQEALSEANIPFDPKAGVADLRALLIGSGLALADAPDLEKPIAIIGRKFHHCEMAGQVISLEPNQKLKVMAWKAEKLVAFGVAEYI